MNLSGEFKRRRTLSVLPDEKRGIPTSNRLIRAAANQKLMQWMIKLMGTWETPLVAVDGLFVLLKNNCSILFIKLHICDGSKAMNHILIKDPVKFYLCKQAKMNKNYNFLH